MVELYDALFVRWAREGEPGPEKRGMKERAGHAASTGALLLDAD